MLHLKVCNIFIIGSISQGSVMQLFLFAMGWKCLYWFFFKSAASAALLGLVLKQMDCFVF